MLDKLILLALVAFYAWGAAYSQQNPEPARCTTDTECIAFCPADDEDCDGGPQR